MTCSPSDTSPSSAPSWDAVPDPGGPVASASRRASGVVRNLVLLVRVVARHAQDDPALLAVQAMRRLPPGARRPLVRVLRHLDGRGRPSRARAVTAFLADRSTEARQELQRLAAAKVPTGRLTAEVAVQLGLDAPPDAAPAVVARSRWGRGDLTGALAVLEGAADRAARLQQGRLTSALQVLTPGYRVPPPRRGDGARCDPGRVVPRGSDGGPRPLHLLTNSLPGTLSGYALRSHSILCAQRAAGMPAEAVTTLGYPVTVGLPLARDLDVVDGVPYHRLLPARLAGTPAARLEQTVEAMLPLVERLRPDVLHTTTHYPNALVARTLAEATGLPWIYEVRGQLEKTWQASRPVGEQPSAASSERFALWHAKETEMARAADHVVVLSEALRSDVEARGVPADRITVVPNAVDAALLADAASPADGRRALGLDPQGFWVGSVSSLVGYEGLDLLLEAVALLRRRGADVRCAIVGDGVARPELLRQAERLGLAGTAVFPGRVPRTAAADWHRALDVFVVPRRDLPVCRTVTPLKPIEAMAAGRPVVASDLPALAEIVMTRQTGLGFPADDPAALAERLQALLDDPALGARLAGNGRSFAATRTWDTMASRYRAVYEQLALRG